MLRSSLYVVGLVLSGAWAAPQGHSSKPTVDLGYAIYEGNALSNGLNEFLGMRFAAPVVGDLRWRKPQPPARNRTAVQSATQFPTPCPGSGSPQPEDCLFGSVYAPADATPKSKLPVFVWIQGGGYVNDADGLNNASLLVSETGNQMVFFEFNYRVSAYGFLASEKVRQNGQLNVGLFDQRAALEWVQQHIEQFGGDPEKVVIVGSSAGAGSVAMHLIAFNAAPTNLFRGAFGQSPFFPTQRTVPELEFEFNQFVNATGCSGAKDEMACLRSKDTATLQAATSQSVTFPGATGGTEFAWSPTIDGEFLVDLPYRMYEQGRFIRMPTIMGDDTNEGTDFAPNASSQADISTFFKNQFPKLTTTDLNDIAKVYPQEPPVVKHAPFFPSAAAAYGETVFICPGLLVSGSEASARQPTWNYRFNVLTPDEIAAGIGAHHTAEVAWVFGNGIAIAPILRAYYTSFVRGLDPNAFPINGSVHWPQIGTGNDEKRILLQDPEQGGIGVENVPADQKARCAFWKGLAIKMEQ